MDTVLCSVRGQETNSSTQWLSGLSVSSKFSRKQRSQPPGYVFVAQVQLITTTGHLLEINQESP